MDELYSVSGVLKDSVWRTAERIANAMAGSVALVEYITLPDFGQRAVLRFGLIEGRGRCLEEIDELESRMRALAGADLWVALVGGAQAVGPGDLTQRLIKIDQLIPADAVRFERTRHSEGIGRDAQVIRGALSLSPSYLVWEIEVALREAPCPPVIRLIDANEPGEGLSSGHHPESVRIGGTEYQVERLGHNPSFSGCIKAYLGAQKHGRALRSFIARPDL